MKRRRYLEPAENVRALREGLHLTQSEFAERLRVTRRTVIRGEQRGLELPLGSWGPRGHVWEAWAELQRQLAKPAIASSSADRLNVTPVVKSRRVTFKARSPAPAIGGKRRLRRAADILRDRKRR